LDNDWSYPRPFSILCEVEADFRIWASPMGSTYAGLSSGLSMPTFI
jgi:hypothetical protein